jgi:predicted esterase
MLSFNYIHPSLLFSLIFIGSFGVASTNETFDAKEVIEQYGSDFSDKNLKSLRTIYKQHLIEANYLVPTIVRDASYGDHSLQKLDIHLPNNPSSKKLPVVVFVHGGAFVRGDKSDHEIFDNVLNYFTRNDVIGININYRLAPEHKWPSGPEDISAVIKWIHNNEEKYDIDKNKIFLMGHSAGAAHVAAYSFDESLQYNNGNDGVSGSILLSGVYSESSDTSKKVYYGYGKNNMPIDYLDGRFIPLFIIDAQYDRILMQAEAINLIQNVCKRDGICPNHKQIPGHNHYSMMYHFNTLDESIAPDILAFINQYKIN